MQRDKIEWKLCQNFFVRDDESRRWKCCYTRISHGVRRVAIERHYFTQICETILEDTYVKRLWNVNNNFLENVIRILIWYDQPRKWCSNTQKIIIVRANQEAFCSRRLNFTWRLFYRRYLNNTKQLGGGRKKKSFMLVSRSHSFIWLCDSTMAAMYLSLPDVMTFRVWPRATFSCTQSVESRDGRVLGCVHLDRHREIESLSRSPHLLSETSTCVRNSTSYNICHCFATFEKWRL